MASSSIHPLYRLVSYCKIWKKRILAASIYSVLNKFFDILPEVLIGLAIDIVVARENSFLSQLGIKELNEQLLMLGLITLLVWGLESITEYAAILRWRNLAQDLQHRVRMDAIEKTQKLSLSWYEKQNTGNLLSILNDDVNQMERFLDKGLHSWLQLFVSSILIGMIFVYISPIIASFAILPIPLILLGGFVFRKNLSKQYLNVRQKAGNLGAKINGIITGNLTIRAAVAETHYIQQVDDASRKYIRANQKAIKLSSAFVPLIRMAVLAGFLFTLLLGGAKALDGTINPASYTVLVFLTQRLLWPFTNFGEILDLFERSMASTKRVLDLVQNQQTEPTNQIQPTMLRTTPEICFEGVGFSYRTDIPVIEDISLKIPFGKFIAFVGPTGTGKTSLIKLMLRFYECSKGKIRIDDHDIKDIQPASIRKMIGYISQDVFLFDGTIEENLRLQKQDASLEDLIECCKIAEIHSFIESLPEKYQTLIGERGQNLSGGQKQRLAIARSLVGDSPILVLDEATSAIDNETEAVIQKSLEKIAHKKTLIVIAHRLSTIRRADTIYLLSKGKIKEKGNHQSLIREDGEYKKLWDIQTGAIHG